MLYTPKYSLTSKVFVLKVTVCIFYEAIKARFPPEPPHLLFCNLHESVGKTFVFVFFSRVETLEFIIVTCRLSFRKDPHGFFAFPVTDAIAPGYSSIIKHPMDFSTMKDRINNNEYNTVTEFKVKTSCWEKRS